MPRLNAVVMPKWGLTMTDGTIAEWLMKEGDAVGEGDELILIETEKAAQEYEAVDSGFLARVIVPDGTEDVDVGTLLGVIADSPDVGAEEIDEFIKNYEPFLD